MSRPASTESRLFTTAVHAGEDPAAHRGALSTPVYRAAVYALPDTRSGSDIHEGRSPGFFYGRMGTPTQAALEAAIGALEGADAALALASGMAAISTALLTVLEPGQHIVAPRALYASTRALLTELLASHGVQVTLVDGTQPEAWAEAVTEHTRMLYAETPANPVLSLVDLEAVVRLAAGRGLVTVVDNTFATPINQRPLELGADLVVHSASKYLGGHGDLVAGALAGRREWVERARWHTAKLLGGVIAPDTASLVLRGIKTLPLRMARHNANAQAVAEFLAAHPKVREVHYPGLATHPQHALACHQMHGFGGLVAFELDGFEAARRLLDSLELCTLAVSLGDVATLVQHSASMTHASVPRAQREASGISDGLVRLSTGIERAEDIIEDLERGFASV